MSEETPPIPLRLFIPNDIPSLLTSLFTFSTSSKFNHVFASCTLATVRRLAHLMNRKWVHLNSYDAYQSIVMLIQHPASPHKRHSGVFSPPRPLCHSALSGQRRTCQRSDTLVWWWSPLSDPCCPFLS